MSGVRIPLPRPILSGSLAQLVEQLAFNQLVAGSDPARPTTQNFLFALSSSNPLIVSVRYDCPGGASSCVFDPPENSSRRRSIAACGRALRAVRSGGAAPTKAEHLSIHL